MGAFYIERRNIIAAPATTLAGDLAHHLYARGFDGKTIVIAPDPASAMGSVRKSWRKLLRVVQRERASTLRPDLIRELSQAVTAMRETTFTTKHPSALPDADVFFMDEHRLATLAGRYRTAYVTYRITDQNYAALDNLLEKGGLLVEYRTGQAETKP